MESSLSQNLMPALMSEGGTHEDERRQEHDRFLPQVPDLWEEVLYLFPRRVRLQKKRQNGVRVNHLVLLLMDLPQEMGQGSRAETEKKLLKE